MNSVDINQLNIFSAFLQLLNWRKIDGIVEQQPDEGDSLAEIKIAALKPLSIFGWEQPNWHDRNKNIYRVFDIRATNQIAFVSLIDGIERVAIVDHNQYGKFCEFAQTLEIE